MTAAIFETVITAHLYILASANGIFELLIFRQTLIIALVCALI